METVTAKWSAVIIAKGDRMKMYGSLADVPQDLRQQLEDAMRAENAATIVIADESGRRELLRAFRGESPELASSLKRFGAPEAWSASLRRWPLRRIAAAATAAGAVALSVWVWLRL